MIWQRVLELGEDREAEVAMHHDGLVLQFGDLCHGMVAFAEDMAALGVRRGDRVAYLGVNDPGQLLHLFACAWLGAVQVPLNRRLAAPELRFILADSGARLCHVGGDAALEALARESAPDRCAVIGERRPPPLKQQVEPVGQADDPLLLVYTSGTTGRPKGAVLTQAAVAANAQNAAAIFALTPADVVLTVLPLFHVGGLNIQTVPALLAGAAVVLHRRFDPDVVFDALLRFRPTLSLLVPAVMKALVAHPRWSSADLSSLRAVGAGSSEVPLPLIEAFHARGVPVQQVYGATETCPIAIAQTREEALAAPGSIGRPAPLCAARIQDAAGRPLPTGVEGEITIRGPNVMAGYWKAPIATASALRGGWFATGDIGRVDEQGRWWFTDRLKHVIISGGENIYPAEVERVLAEAPGVAEGAVVGRPDPQWGEVPVAVVVPGPGFDPAKVLAHFDGRIARFKRPRDVVTVDAMPRTALGKIETGDLKKIVSR